MNDRVEEGSQSDHLDTELKLKLYKHRLREIDSQLTELRGEVVLQIVDSLALLYGRRAVSRGIEKYWANEDGEDATNE